MRKVVGLAFLCGSVFLGLILHAGGRVGLRIAANEVVKANVGPHADRAANHLGYFVLGVVLLCVSLFLLARTSRARRYWVRWFSPYADEVLSKDSRAPVLLLRAFDDDDRIEVSVSGLRQSWIPGKQIHTLEQALSACLSRYGPVIAIGRPKEWAPPVGAARLYVKDDWQEKVLRLVRESQIVVVILGRTEGLLWELEQLMTLLADPDQILPVL